MSYKELLNKNGIVDIECEEFSDDNLLHLASSFGKVVPGARGELVQTLPAREKGEGPQGSFSYTVGYSAFPWHTDTAYWEIPARYLLLASEEKSLCATTYQSFDTIRDSVEDFDYLMTRSIFLLNVPGIKRYLSPRFESRGDVGYRLDFHIYLPVNEEAVVLMKRVGKVLEKNYYRFLWSGRNLVLLDNWKIIHAREDANIDKTRVLKRIYINELV